MLRRCCFTVLAFIVTVGLAQAAPDAAKSEYLQTTGGGISIAGGKEPLFYSLILQVRKDLDGPLYVRTFFDRPGAPDDPLVEDSVIKPDDDTVFIESPRFQGIENGATYRVIVVLYTDEGRENELSRHEQEIHFEGPKKALKKAGVKFL